MALFSPKHPNRLMGPIQPPSDQVLGGLFLWHKATKGAKVENECSMSPKYTIVTRDNFTTSLLHFTLISYSANKLKIYFGVNSACSHKAVTAKQIKDSESMCFGFKVYPHQMPFVQE